MTLKNFDFGKIGYKNKMIIVAAVFVLGGALLTYGVIKPAVSHINDLKRNIIDQKVELEQGVAEEENMKKLNENLAKIDSQLVKFENIFINQGRDLEFITTLEAIANKNNIEQKIGLGQPSGQENKTYKKIPLELTVSGKYHDLLNYLADLESLNYYLIINFLEFSNTQSSPASPRGAERDRANAESGNIVLKIAADTYWK
jgi:Tfp pilus assembly protein PilO